MNKKFMFSMLMLLGIWASSQDTLNVGGKEQFIGRWEGQGNFYNVNFSIEHGSVEIDLRIDDALNISGSVGSAQISGAELTVDDWNDGYKIEAKVEGRMFPGKSFEKDYVVFLLKEPEGGVIQGDFHVKSNLIFDFTMRPGAISLRKNP